MKAPVPQVIVAPGGEPESSEKQSVLGGISASVAVAVRARVDPAVTVLLPIGVRTGAWFTSFTVTVNVSKSLWGGLPLSVTRTVIGRLPGPCASDGVQLNAPVDAPMVAPAGAPASSEKLRMSPAFGSVAVAVKVRSASSFTVLFPIADRTGAWPAPSAGTIVIVSKSLSGGVPLSVTRIVTGTVPL